MIALRPWIREVLIFIAAMAAVAIGCRLLPGQDGAQSVLEQQHAAGTLEPIPLTTGWQIETQKALDALGIKAAFRNKSFSLVIPEGEYDFVSLRIPKNVSLIADPTTTRSVRLRYVGAGDTTLVTLQGYGSRFSGFDLIAKDPKAPRLLGVHVDIAMNAEVDRIRFAHYGVDSLGVLIAGRESITVQKCEFRCSVPVAYRSGDNIVFRDMDIGGATSADSLAVMNDQFPSTVVWLQGQPNQVVFDGSQTWQGCTHAIYGEIEAPRTGQNLNIYNLRYEQPLTPKDAKTPAVYLKFADRGFENLVFVGCRWSDRANGIEISGPPNRFIPRVTIVGSRMPGTRSGVSE